MLASWSSPRGWKRTCTIPPYGSSRSMLSRLGYDEWHIDGAVLWDVYRDLKDAGYRLADTAALERLLARSGIGPDSTVVCYGYAPAMGFWLMKLDGHADVRILNCSRDAWRAEGRPGSGLR